MKRNFAVKLDIYKMGYIDQGKPQSYVFDWFMGGNDNPTYAFTSLQVNKNLNSFSLNATLSILPVRNSSGNSWYDLLDIMDMATISIRIGTDESTTEYVVFFGFITDITEHMENSEFGVMRTIQISLESIGLLFMQPYLSFDKITDTFAALMGVNKDVWYNLQAQSISGTPKQILQNLLERFDAFISNLYIQTKQGKVPIKSLLSYTLRDVQNLPMILFSLQSLLQGADLGNFWQFVQQITEVKDGIGWVHEVWFDILSQTQLDAISSLGSNSITSYATPIPSSANEAYYLCLIMRPNPLPYLSLSEPQNYLTADAMLGSNGVLNLAVAQGVEYSSTDFDNILSSKTLMHEYSTNLLLDFSKSKNTLDVKTVFGTQMMIEQSVDPGWDIPLVVDAFNYARKGYDPLWISTRYLQVVSNINPALATEKTSILPVLLNMNLRSACYNGALDLYSYGTATVPLDPTITVGGIIKLTNFQTQEIYYLYVQSVNHSISAKGSYTQVTFSRLIDKTIYDNLQSELEKRFVLTTAMNAQDYLEKKYYPAVIADFTQSLESV